MTIARFSHQLESSNLGHTEENDLISLTANRWSSAPTGGFADNWHDQSGSNTANVSETPFKLLWYSVRVWTTRPCIVWSSDVEQYRSVQAGGANNTDFNQFNIANDTVKKWTLTDGGRTWSKLAKTFVSKKRMKTKNGRVYYKTVGKPRYYNNKQFKIQIQNIDPNTTPQDCAFYSIVEGAIEYDAS